MISVVVPVYNEEESVEHFFEALITELQKIKEDFEILFIDDGSKDRSFEILSNIVKKNKKVSLFSLRRNVGKAEALSLGFLKAKGDIIVTLDADLQDQPSEIKNLLSVFRQGFDVVCGWRKNRKDKSRMKIISKLFNLLVGTIFEVKIHDYNCGLKLYSSEAAKSLRLYGGLHRFIPILAHEQGFSVTEVVVDHKPREFGKSKYGFSKIFKDVPDMFTMMFLVKYMKQPLHFFGTIGGLLIVSGFIILGYLSVLRFFGEKIGTRPLFLFGILLFLAGIQIFFTGFLAELLISITHRKDSVHFPISYDSSKDGE